MKGNERINMTVLGPKLTISNNTLSYSELKWTRKGPLSAYKPTSLSLMDFSKSLLSFSISFFFISRLLRRFWYLQLSSCLPVKQKRKKKKRIY